ncbi:MAG TPA: phospholipase D-like domain-containing protein [Gammaproteobacteria bacterium]|nr:phospholipase D-like domain-containing protein [Gammaproteobacteria bacterium]
MLLLAALAASMPTQARHYPKHTKLSESCTLPHPAQTTATLTGAKAMVDFSPGGDGEALILQAIAAAQHAILMQAYSFTDRRIITALAEARARGVEVRVILDKTDTQPYEGHEPVASVISSKQIPVWIDSSVHIAHNKVMIIDGNDLITGSYNFTYSADYDNAENLLYIRNAPQLVKAYISNWYWRQSCSRAYAGKSLN